MTASWHIVAPGPSLGWDWWPAEGFVACINQALRDAPACDYWVCFDRPKKEIHDTCWADATRLRPKLVTRHKALPQWEPWGLEMLDGRKETQALSWLWNLTNRNYSSYMAIAFAVQRGARHLAFHGMDLSGVGYAGGVDPLKRSDDHWDQRWNDENLEGAAIRNIMSELDRRGFKLEGLPPHVRP